MKEILLVVLGLLLISTPVFAEGKFIVNGTNKGQFTDLAVTGAGSSTVRTGIKATIDLSSLAQTTADSASPVVTMTQAGTTAGFINFVGTAGTTGQSTITTYSATAGTKAGTIKILVNGAERFIDFKAVPN